MASILMGTVTAMLMLLMGGGCFICGYKAGSLQPPITDERSNTQPTEEQKRLAEGFTNLLNYANRHKKNN